MPDVPRQILILSHEAAAGRAVAERIGRLGYAVGSVVSSVDEALGFDSHPAPDLVIVSLADGRASTGAELIASLQRNDGTPVLLLVGASDEASLHATGVSDPHLYALRDRSDRELHVGIELALCRHDQTRAVRELENRFFTESIDMLCFLDYNGYFKRLNPAWERTLGFSRDELMSRRFIEFVHPDDRERTLNQNAEVRGGGQALAFENRYLCRDGSYRWFRWNAAPDSIEQVIYSVARDVTAEKQATEERETLMRELQAAMAEVTALRRILPLCSYCRKIRDDENYWHTVESYLARTTATKFSHGICPSCMETVVEPQLTALDQP